MPFRGATGTEPFNAAAKARLPDSHATMGSIQQMADLMSGHETTDSTDTETDSDDSAVPEVFEELGADIDRVKAAIDHYGEDSIEGMVEFAEALANDDELFTLAEEYRLSNGIKRIRYFYGFDRGGDYLQEWFRRFFGDTDDPEEGTHNYIQQQAADAGVNLAWYKIMFPEPVDEHVPDCVQVTDFDYGLPWEEDTQDSNIFVPQWYAEEFAEHTNDEGIPLPPADAPEDSGADTDDLPFDPADFNVDEVSSRVSDIDDQNTLVRLNEAERDGKDRDTVHKRIGQRINAVGDIVDTDEDDGDMVELLAEEKGLDESETELLRKLLD